ncbi:transposase and inactivated derivatives [Microbacterium testaceum StLB037]|uniref:Transposase and inactivated derivatives n=1 Tax=Microbacterium testaceum (strain StLB037) TaxID=979556 RepID=E8N9S3_MICTS|nr:transposase and inactivated derivatives [Microbacterium testaceum StLB037]
MAANGLAAAATVAQEDVRLDVDECRSDGTTALGVDEHIWHYLDPRKRSPNWLTMMVDPSRDRTRNTRARRLDLVPGRPGEARGSRIADRGESFRRNVELAVLGSLAGSKTAPVPHRSRATLVHCLG